MASNPITSNTIANNPVTNSPAANPLDQLRDIHLPEPISWWPPAPGWWFLALCGAVLLGWLATLLYRRYRANHYRRQALAKLHQLESQLESRREPQTESQQPLQALFALLRQTANSAYPSRQPGNLSIQQFVGFMQSSCAKPLFESSDLDLELLLYAKTEGDSVADRERLAYFFKDAKRWIAQHLPEHKLEAGC